MNLPQFNAEASLGVAIGIYWAKAGFGSCPVKSLSMQEFLVPAGRGIASNLSTNNPLPSPTETTTSLSLGCTPCYLYSSTGPFGQTIFGGNKYCCGVICIPYLGCRRHCWTESCDPFSTGTIAT
jgi:hypothetical protein